MAAQLQQFPRLKRSLFAATLALLGTAALAQDVALSGRMGERALLVIDGQAYTAGVGQTVGGVKVLRWAGDDAVVEHRGASVTLRVGGTPVRLGAGAPRSSGRELVLAAGPGGHFHAAGSINGKAVRFMVDTGATLVSIGREDAQRLGLDLSNARFGLSQTANGTVPTALITLTSVRVGDIELANVQASVVQANMPFVLLGNSFLSRLQMKRENDVMRLELR